MSWCTDCLENGNAACSPHHPEALVCHTADGQACDIRHSVGEICIEADDCIIGIDCSPVNLTCGGHNATCSDNNDDLCDSELVCNMYLGQCYPVGDTGVACDEAMDCEEGIFCSTFSHTCGDVGAQVGC